MCFFSCYIIIIVIIAVLHVNSCVVIFQCVYDYRIVNFALNYDCVLYSNKQWMSACMHASSRTNQRD